MAISLTSTLTSYKPKANSSRRAILLSLLLGASGLTGLSLNYLNLVKENVSNRDRNLRISRTEGEYLVQKFKVLPKSEKKWVLSYLDDNIIPKTKIIWSAVQNLLDIKVLEEEDESIPNGIYLYSPFQNKIIFNNPSRRTQVRQYLKGEPLSLALPHEKIHAIQDSSSKWHEFEAFSKDIIDVDKLKIKGKFSREKSKEFSRKWLKRETAYEESKKEFTNLLEQYQNTMDERRIIREDRAFLTFCPFTDPESFYNRLFPYADFGEILPRVGKEKFNWAFYSTLELLALLPAKEAAEFAGKNGDSIEQYKQAVDRLKADRNLTSPHSSC